MEFTKRSVDSLEKIYAVIIALAIGKTLTTIFPGGDFNSDLANNAKFIPALFSFFLLVVPFYHGMNRHLDFCYLSKKKEDIKEWGLLIDFIVFCLESSLLFVFANYIKSGINCYIILGLILAIDVIWGFVSHLIHYGKITSSLLKWCIINFLAIILGYLNFVIKNAFTDFSKEINFLLIMLLRTIADYWTSWSFYFPKNEAES